MNRISIRFSVPILLIVVFFGTVTIAALPDGISNEGIVGYWFGIFQQESIDGDIQAIAHFKADGNFRIKFRIVQNGRPVAEQEESGRWNLKENLKTMVTTYIDGEHLEPSKYITDTYLIKKLTHAEMDYEDIKTGKKFKAIRVQESFKFP